MLPEWLWAKIVFTYTLRHSITFVQNRMHSHRHSHNTTHSLAQAYSYIACLHPHLYSFTHTLTYGHTHIHVRQASKRRHKSNSAIFQISFLCTSGGISEASLMWPVFLACKKQSKLCVIVPSVTSNLETVRVDKKK